MKLMFLLIIGFIIISCSDESSKSEIYGCPEKCQEWEYCDLINNTCELDQTSNFCNVTSDCDNGYICNDLNHKCELKSINCDNMCSSWESCEDGSCKLNEGSCYLNHDCKDENSYCNIEEHKCMQLDNLCDLDCDSWENCIITDDNEKKCIKKNSFKWERVEIEGINDKSSVYSPFKVGLYGYNPIKNTIINYFSKQDDAFSISKIDLGIKSQLEEVLTVTESSMINSFCDNDVSKCQLITYNKSKERFMILGLESKSLLYINDLNVTEKIDIEGEYPKGIVNYTSSFNLNGNTLYLYNNKPNELDKAELYTFSTEDMTWKLEMEGLPNISGNCLVPVEEDLYSFGGIYTISKNDYTTSSYKINSNNKTIDTVIVPDEINYRTSISCTYDDKRELIFIYAGSRVYDDYDEVENLYYNDLWSFSPKNKEWKLILKNIDNGSFLPMNENGYRVYDADINKPNFGKNMGKMIYDEEKDRLIIMGDVPSDKGIQIYTIKL